MFAHFDAAQRTVVSTVATLMVAAMLLTAALPVIPVA
jgi:hypothetical protein